MRKLFDGDGKEVEVPTEEEIKVLETKAKAAGDSAEATKLLKDVRDSLGLKDGDDLVKAVKLAKESSNPNWGKIRSKLKKYESFIKKHHKDAVIDDDGEIQEPDGSMSKKDVAELAEKTTREALIRNKRDTLLNQYPEDKRDVMKKQFKIQSASAEGLDDASVARFMTEAEGIVFPEGVPSKTQDHSGGAPVHGDTDEEGSGFAKTQQGEAVGDAMGLRSNTPEAKKEEKEDKKGDK